MVLARARLYKKWTPDMGTMQTPTIQYVWLGDVHHQDVVQCSTVQYSTLYVSSVLVLYLLCCLAAIITHETYKV